MIAVFSDCNFQSLQLVAHRETAVGPGFWVALEVKIVTNCICQCFSFSFQSECRLQLREGSKQELGEEGMLCCDSYCDSEKDGAALR